MDSYEVLLSFVRKGEDRLQAAILIKDEGERVEEG